MKINSHKKKERIRNMVISSQRNEICIESMNHAFTKRKSLKILYNTVIPQYHNEQPFHWITFTKREEKNLKSFVWS